MKTGYIRALACAFFCSGLVAVAAVPVEDLQVESTALLVRRSGAGGLQESASLRQATGPNTYITSAAVSPHDPAHLLVATTFHGVYESRDGGATWIDIGDSAAGRAIYRATGSTRTSPPRRTIRRMPRSCGTSLPRTVRCSP
jgi:hypothetical protein